MQTRSLSKRPCRNTFTCDQKTFLSDLAAWTTSRICSHLCLKDFLRFQSSSKSYQKQELYNGKRYAGLQAEIQVILRSKNCPNPDEISANIVKRGGRVKFHVYSSPNCTSLGRTMIRSDYFLLCRALVDRAILTEIDINHLLVLSVTTTNHHFLNYL